MIKIYVLEKNNIPFYIGKAKNIIRRKHSHTRTYGLDIQLYVIDEVKDWKYWECYWIEQFKQWGFKLENKNNGGGGPSSYTEEQKDKMRKPRKEGTGDKISKTLKERNHSKYYTEEVRQRMRENLKGSHGGSFTEEHTKNLTKSHRKRSKKVLMYNFQGELVKEWENKGEAVEWVKENNKRARKQNVNSQIKDCCFGKIKSCWGYIWRYEGDNTPLVPKFKTVYQFDINFKLINEFKSLFQLKEWISKNLPNRNISGISSLIKKHSQNKIYKVDNNYYSINKEI